MTGLASLPDSATVVRGGHSSPEDIQRTQRRDPCGHIFCQVGDCSVEELARTPHPFPNSGLTITTVGAIRQLSGWDVLAVPGDTNRWRGCLVPPGIPRERKHDFTADWRLLPLPEGNLPFPIDTNFNCLGPTRPAVSHQEAEAWGLRPGLVIKVRQDDDQWTGTVKHDPSLPWYFQWYIDLDAQ